MKTSNQSRFAHVPSADIQRSVFERDHTHKTTFNCGRLIPFYLDEVLPGDTFDISTSFVARTTTPIFPVMDDLEIEFFYFFVPNRLVWEAWQNLHGENTTGAWAPAVPPAQVPPVSFSSNPLSVQSLGDYFGLPLGVSLSSLYGNNRVNGLPFRAYALIWNEWFRDQNLQAPVIVPLSNSAITTSLDFHPSNQPFRVNKKHDYFTSCLPAPQKGTSVYLPLGPIPVIPMQPEVPAHLVAGADLRWKDFANNLSPSGGLWSGQYQSVSGIARLGTTINSNEQLSDAVRFPIVPSNLWAAGSDLASVTELRQAFQLQRLFERDARGGTRYTEIIRSHFGVVSPDSRLQRPEYLGGFKERLGMQQVVQMSSTDSASPQGNTAAFSLTSSRHGGVRQSFTEHGYILGLLTVRQRKTYQNGADRLWFKRDRFDFYYPALAHISEQPVYNREISSNTATPNEVFGYQEAWAEYRFKPNRVSGYFRSTSPAPLDSWHYADNYGNNQVFLSAGWMQDNTDVNVDRTLAVSSSQAPQIIADIYIANRAARPMPVYSVPGLVDHF